MVLPQFAGGRRALTGLLQCQRFRFFFHALGENDSQSGSSRRDAGTQGPSRKGSRTVPEDNHCDAGEQGARADTFSLLQVEVGVRRDTCHTGPGADAGKRN